MISLCTEVSKITVYLLPGFTTVRGILQYLKRSQGIRNDIKFLYTLVCARKVDMLNLEQSTQIHFKRTARNVNILLLRISM